MALITPLPENGFPVVSIIPKIEQVNPFTYYDGTDTSASDDYKCQKTSLERMDIFIREIKRAHFKYTNAFLGNLIEKDGPIRK